MGKKLIGVLLLLVIGGVALVAGKMGMNYFKEREQVDTSDAANIRGKIRIATDSWIGYYPLCSDQMKREMHQAGWLLACVDDQGDYRERMARLAKGEYDLAVATVDSYLINGRPHDFPGAIVAVVDESKGGDAIVARSERVANLDAIRETDGLRVAFTPNSPSHYLLKAASDHFDLPGLLPRERKQRVETKGSDKALDKLLTGGADIAALWEPDVSKALAASGVVKLLGTEETERLIVDILLANRKFIQRHPEAVSRLLYAYFRVLKHYRTDPERLVDDLTEQTGVKKKAAQAMVQGVAWQGLVENCEQWFGIASPGVRAEEQLIPTIESTIEILRNSGDFSRSPLPDNDPYRLLNRSFLEELYQSTQSGITRASGTFSGKKEQPDHMSPLSERGWAALSEVGTLKLKPIGFRRGSATLDNYAGIELDQAAEKLSHYPGFRVLVKGHTGTRGDAEANKQLSQQRAASVAEYLVRKHQLDSNRLHAVGLGGSIPLKKQEQESTRAYEQRLSRVELVLVREQL